MRISEQIRQLEELKREYGDLDMLFGDSGDGYRQTAGLEATARNTVKED